MVGWNFLTSWAVVSYWKTVSWNGWKMRYIVIFCAVYAHLWHRNCNTIHYVRCEAVTMVTIKILFSGMLRRVICWNVIIFGHECAASIFTTEDRRWRASEKLVTVYPIIRCHHRQQWYCIRTRSLNIAENWNSCLDAILTEVNPSVAEPLSKQLPCEQRPSQSTRFWRWWKEQLGAEVSGAVIECKRMSFPIPFTLSFWIILCCDVVAYFVVVIYMQWTNGSCVLLVRVCSYMVHVCNHTVTVTDSVASN
jgi:hypothetical protein